MTASTKFTAGPWKVYRTSDGRSILGVGDKNGGGVTDSGDVSTNDLGVWRSGAERDANAALIAAAPALYDALMAVLEGVNGARSDEDLDCSTEVGGYLLGDVMNDALDAANAALAAARGEG